MYTLAALAALVMSNNLNHSHYNKINESEVKSLNTKTNCPVCQKPSTYNRVCSKECFLSLKNKRKEK